MEIARKIDYLNTKIRKMIEAYSKMIVVNGVNGGNGVKLLIWIRPLELAVKISVDGSSNFTKLRTRVGCVMRDHHGKFRGNLEKRKGKGLTI